MVCKLHRTSYFERKPKNFCQIESKIKTLIGMKTGNPQVIIFPFTTRDIKISINSIVDHFRYPAMLPSVFLPRFRTCDYVKRWSGHVITPAIYTVDYLLFTIKIPQSFSHNMIQGEVMYNIHSHKQIMVLLFYGYLHGIVNCALLCAWNKVEKTTCRGFAAIRSKKVYLMPHFAKIVCNPPLKRF